MILAIDTETTGTDFFHGCAPFLVTGCDGETNYIWKGSVNPYTREVFWDEEEIRSLQEHLNKAHKLVLHNAQFDFRALETIGININNLWGKVEDTLIASHCICSGDVHNLKDLAIKYLDYWNEDEKLLEAAVKVAVAQAKKDGYRVAKEGDSRFPGLKGSVVNWWKMDYWLVPEACVEYGLCDVERTWLLWDAFKIALLEDNLFGPYNIRKSLLRVCYNITSHGKNFYKDKAQEEVTYLRQQMETIRWDIKTLSGIDYRFDPNKRDHLVDLIHYRCKVPVLFQTNSGAPCVDKNALMYYERNYDVPAIAKLAQYRKAMSRAQHIESYLRWLDDNNHTHSNLNITGTRETRQSSSSPNDQNVDKSILQYFGPPPGNIWLHIDMVNIELRIWAYSVGNKELIQAFEAGRSVHLMIMETIMPERVPAYLRAKAVPDRIKTEDDWKAMSYYTKIKNGNFARIYGATDTKTNETYYGTKDAPNYCAIIDKRFPGIKEFMQSKVSETYHNIDIYNVPSIVCLGGYRLDVPLEEPFKACNYYIQGSAGWIMTLAMLAVDSNSEYKQYNCHMIGQVHDALDIEIPLCNNIPRIIDSISGSIEAAGRKIIPTCDVSYDILYNPSDETYPFVQEYNLWLTQQDKNQS